MAYLPSPTALGSAKLPVQGRLHRVTQKAASVLGRREASKLIASRNRLRRLQAAVEDQFLSVPLMSSSRGSPAGLERTAMAEEGEGAAARAASRTSAIVEAMRTTRRIAIREGVLFHGTAPGRGLSMPAQQVAGLASAGTRNRAPMRTDCALLASRPAGLLQHTQCTIS